jgi:hypothetical protein
MIAQSSPRRAHRPIGGKIAPARRGAGHQHVWIRWLLLGSHARTVSVTQNARSPVAHSPPTLLEAQPPTPDPDGSPQALS